MERADLNLQITHVQISNFSLFHFFLSFFYVFKPQIRAQFHTTVFIETFQLKNTGLYNLFFLADLLFFLQEKNSKTISKGWETQGKIPQKTRSIRKLFSFFTGFQFSANSNT